MVGWAVYTVRGLYIWTQCIIEKTGKDCTMGETVLYSGKDCTLEEDIRRGEIYGGIEGYTPGHQKIHD